VPPVRPTAQPGPLGLVLPTAWQGETPGPTGTTFGDTKGSTAGAARSLATACTEAEAAGAGALWAVDHLFWPRPMFECLTTLAVAAAATERVTIGSCVLQLPLRTPTAVAKQVASLQVLSGDRFVLGVGVGSHPGEYAVAGADFAARGRALDDGLDALELAWATSGDPELTYRLDPTGAPVPIWIGGSSPAAIRRAARRGHGWVPLFISVDDYRRGLAALDAEIDSAGRAPEDVTRAVVVFARVGEPEAATAAGLRWLSSLYGIPERAFASHLIAGDARSCAARLAAYRDAGAAHVAVMLAADHAVEQFTELAAACGTIRNFDQAEVAV
jgi:alkanesulfonate monooxygenase SsuD/methylene tetrahydromethanopterin reductase-like flavin-dependent oxidoreductase (luciferase family)